MGKLKVDRATPQITEPNEAAETLVTTANTAIGNINASPALAGAGDVVTTVKNWAAANAALDANNKAKAAAQLQLDAAIAAEGPLVRRWGARKRAVLSAIEIAGDGSAELVAAFNVTVEQRQAAPVAAVPVNLRPMKVLKSANASVRWDPTPGANGYMLQHATSPNDPTTYSPQIHVSAAKFRLGAQTPGATIYFRVLALDPSPPLGQTGFTAWVATIVAP